MPISIETRDRDKPLLLIVGSTNLFIKKLISEFKNDFKIAQITKDKKKENDIYNIDPKKCCACKKS